MPRGRGGRWSDAFREEETELGSRAVTGRMYQGRLPGGGGLQRGVWNSAGQMEKREPPGKGTCLPSRGAEGGERVAISQSALRGWMRWAGLGPQVARTRPRAPGG